MQVTTKKIPTIQNDIGGYNFLLKLINEVFENPNALYEIDFQNCYKLSHNGVVVLGSLARYIEIQSAKFVAPQMIFKVSTMPSTVKNSLIYNNFLNTFNRSHYNSKAYSGYQEHTNTLDENTLTKHLETEWLCENTLKIDSKQKGIIISHIIEIFMNAYGHGISTQSENKKSLGIYSCGEYDRKNKLLHMSILDFGIGIVKNVQSVYSNLSDIQAMNWALTRGNSTNTDSNENPIPRGLGFDLLKSFVHKYGGELKIYSNSVVAQTSDKSKENLYNIDRLPNHMPGTLVSITIKCQRQQKNSSTDFKCDLLEGLF